MSTTTKIALHNYLGPLTAALVFLVGFAWQLRAYATLPERVQKIEEWVDRHQDEVVVIRLDLESRLSRIEEKLDRMLSARVNSAIDSAANARYKTP